MPERATARTPVPAPRTTPAPARREAVSAKRDLPVAGPPVLRLVPPAARREEGLDEVLKSPGPGVPLPDATRRRLESSLRVDLSSVRVHTDSRAARIVDRLRARAFTFGRRIFLGSREGIGDLPLIAHEAAHVVQQRGRPVMQMSTGVESPVPLEREADRASLAVQRQETTTVTGRTDGPAIQRQERLGSIEDGPAKEEEDEGFIESRVWSMLGTVGQELRAIKRKGIVGWLLDRIQTGMQTLVDRLLEPIRPLLAAITWVRAQFAQALDAMREAATQIAKNDCSAVTKAVGRIQEIANLILSAVKDKLEAATAKVKDFFNRLWEKFGAPVWETLKEIGGAVWDKIQQLGAWIWEKTQPVRDWLSRAWTWLKNQLGVGEGEEGQNGLLQWVQRKAGEAWAWLKPKIEPYKKPLLVAAGIVVLFSPAGPFLLMAGGIAAFIKAVQWIRQNMSSRNAVVEQRNVLERTVLPTVMKVSDKLGATLTSVAGEIGKSLGGIAASLGAAVGELAGSAVAFLMRAVAWIQAQVQALAAWAQEQFGILSARISEGLTKLKAFLQPVLDFLGKVAGVVIDIYTLPAVILGKLWRMIPACIREPFVNFLIEQILKRIPLFKTVTETIPAIWNRIKNTAMVVIQKIFKEGDLKGAALEVLKLVLDALEVPIELFTAIFSKTPALLDKIMEDPGRFLGNMLRALKEGVLGFGSRILQHLLGGLTNWLLGQLKDANVTPPADFSLKSVFAFVLDILGLNFEMVMGRLEKKNKPAAVALRKIAKVVSEVWSWISTLLNEGPEGVWKRLREKLSDLWGALIASASQWIITKVATIALAKVSALAAAPVGTVISGIVLIYDTIRAIARYLKQMLEVINGVLDMGLDIAGGVIAGAAKLVESLLQKALGLALGFLAQYAGFGDLGKKIAEIIGTIREKVAEAVDWLLDKAIAAIKGLVGAVKTGVAKIVDWWNTRAPFKRGGKTHTVAFKGGGSDAAIMVEGSTATLDTYLNNAAPPVSAAVRKKIDAERKIIDDIKKKTPSFGPGDGEKIRDALLKIGTLLGNPFPPTVVVWDESYKPKGFSDIVGKHMTAKPLTPNPGAYIGSRPSGDGSGLWQGVRVREGTYVQGHLLNHNLYGPGKAKNLVPITDNANTQMEKSFENDVKKSVLDEGLILEYEVDVEFGGWGPRVLKPEEELPTALLMTAKILDDNLNPTQTLFSKKRQDVTLGPNKGIGFHRKPVVLQEDDAKWIAEAGIPGVGIGYATKIVARAAAKKLHTFADLEGEIPTDLWKSLRDDPENQKFVRLYKQS